MNGRYFLDTNVLVYSFDDTAGKKQDLAKELIRRATRDRRSAISFQVIQEFITTARKFATPMPFHELRLYVTAVLAPLCEVHSSILLYESALRICERSGYAFYDSLILAAAASTRCETLYSEDLQAGQTVAGVKIVNPFAGP